MFAVTINIDPQNTADLTWALDFIQNLPAMSRAKEKYDSSTCTTFSSQRSINNSTDLNEKVAELEKDIERHRKENEKNQKEIQQKSDSISELVKDKSDSDKKYKELEEKLQNELNKSEKKEENFNLQLKSTEESFNRKLQQKDEEIKKLKKLLESYSVSFGSDDPSEKIYFEVTKDNTLEESMISSDSLYCANKCGEYYKFTINNDGPMKAATSNIDILIEPFCTIQDRIEGANAITIVSVGNAKLIGSSLQIIEKAVVSLIKQ